MGNNYLNLPDEFTWPAYDGRSIANIPAAVAQMLHAPFDGLPLLEKKLWQPIAAGAKRVVVLKLDAFGWNLLQAEQSNLARLLRKADLVEQITSIFPSTTVAALSSMWTGSAPAQHGLVGLTMFFPQYATGGQMLAFTPIFGRFPDALVEAGLDPESFLQWQGMAQQLARYGLPTYAYKGRAIVDSALSKMHGRGVTGSYGVFTFSDMLAQMGQLLDEKAGESLYMSAYWPTIDSLSHYRLWDGTATRSEIRALFHQIETEFLNRLTSRARQDTLLFITADHGQKKFSHHIFLTDHPRLQEMLLMQPMGEMRVLYLYAKHGRIPDILAYLNQHFSHAMIAMPSEDALAAGLFGPEPHTAVALERLGDIVMIMRENFAFVIPGLEKLAQKMKGGHGGMTHAEMQVPWIGFRLDGW